MPLITNHPVVDIHICETVAKIRQPVEVLWPVEACLLTAAESLACKGEQEQST